MVLETIPRYLGNVHEVAVPSVFCAHVRNCKRAGFYDYPKTMNMKRKQDRS